MLMIRPDSFHQFQLILSTCLDAVCEWMRANRLQLNASKTEVLWCATSHRQHQIPTTAVRVGADTVTPTTSVRDLGIYIDSDLSMRTQVTRTVAGCFAVLRQLHSIRRSALGTRSGVLVTGCVIGTDKARKSQRIASVCLLRAEVGRRHVVMCHTHTSLWIARTRLSRQHFTPLVTTPSGARTVLSDNPVRGRVSFRLSPSHTTCLSQSGL